MGYGLEKQSYYTKVVGVTYNKRQLTVSKLKEGDRLFFKREPSNPYDKFAVQVVTKEGEQIGYISKDYSESLSINILNGTKYVVTVSAVTGGGFDIAYGVNIRVEY